MHNSCLEDLNFYLCLSVELGLVADDLQSNHFLFFVVEGFKDLTK